MGRLVGVLLLATAGWLFVAPASAAEPRLRLSTTTSTESSGLLKELLPPFEKANGVKVDVIAVGTGKALKLGENGDVDVVFVHARAAEDKFVADGFGVDRRDVMHNDFVVVGPKTDPVGLAGAKTAAEAFQKLAAGTVPFISRGDDSGTHKMELALWGTAGVAPKGAWYVAAGQGMGEVLNMAHEKRAYALADRGTFIAHASKLDLGVVFAGDQTLFNPYGIIAVNPAKHPHAQIDLVRKLIDFITGSEGQKIIAGFQVNGQQLFFPDAKPNP